MRHLKPHPCFSPKLTPFSGWVNYRADPVILAATGRSYDRGPITEWFQLHPETDPSSGEPLKEMTVIPNLNLKEQIREWKAAATGGDASQRPSYKVAP